MASKQPLRSDLKFMAQTTYATMFVWAVFGPNGGKKERTLPLLDLLPSPLLQMWSGCNQEQPPWMEVIRLGIFIQSFVFEVTRLPNKRRLPTFEQFLVLVPPHRPVSGYLFVGASGDTRCCHRRHGSLPSFRCVSPSNRSRSLARSLTKPAALCELRTT